MAERCSECGWTCHECGERIVGQVIVLGDYLYHAACAYPLPPAEE